jgi:hypothetical protein
VPTVLLTRGRSGVPFDVQGLRFIRYRASRRDLAELTRGLRTAIRKVLAPRK